MPMRMGGLGLRSATRTSPTAYWASWADALHMISQRLPEVANDIVTQLAGEPAGCLAELQSAADDLDRCGFVGRPSWEALNTGANHMHPRCQNLESGSTAGMVLSQSSAADQAHLRSHSSPGAGSLFHGSPIQLEYQVQPVLFRTLLLERDEVNCRLRDMNATVRSDDERVLEVLASGLPLHHGAQLAVDITLRSALTAAGLPSPSAAHVNGAALARARRDKERKYGVLLEGDRCHLVVVGVETGGRWSQEACNFVTSLAAGRCRDVPPVLSRSAHLARQRRWMRMLAISCGKASQPLCCPLRKTLGQGPDLFAEP